MGVIPLTLLGANGITRAMPTYFFIAFVIAFGEIFLTYFWNSLQIFFERILKLKKIILHIILLRFMLQIWPNMSFSKKLKSIYKFFYYLKTSITVFDGCSCQCFIHWINFKLIHMFP
jgi:hypothetical protein